jgi:DNA-binding MarR family transcriptional regulator
MAFAKRGERMKKNNALVFIGSLREKTHQLVDAELRKAGITDLASSQGAVLAALYKHNGRLLMKGIARSVHRDKSTVTYLTDKLTQNGYVRKEQDITDKRASYISLTDKGWEFKEVFQAISEKLNEKLYGSLSDEQAQTLEQLLEIIDNNFLI